MAIVINPTTGEEIKDKTFRTFVNKVIQFLYDHHKVDFCNLIKLTDTNLEIDYGTARIKSIFYNNPTVAHVPWPKPYSFSGISGDFYLCKDWNVKPRYNNADFDHLKEMIDVKFPMYKVNKVGVEYQLDYVTATVISSVPVTPHPSASSHRPITDVPTSADNLIRADYSYLRSLTPHSGAMPASHFDLTSTILASTGNISFLAIMDRIPVYVVDNKFMQEHFDKEGACKKYNILLLKLRRLLERILDIFHGKESIEKLSGTIKATRELIEQLRRFKEYGNLIWQIEEFLDSVENWMNVHGVSSALKNPNFESWLKRIIDDIPLLPMSTEYLGVYCHEWKRKNGFNEKAIFVCWQRIRDCAEHGHAIELLTKVTMHEFCHAYMDVIAGSGRACKDIYHWMEESMANVLTLKVIENYATKHPSAIQLFEYAKSFMLKQPDAYASAVRMWENGICDYNMWAWNKDKCVAANSVKNWYNEMSVSWKTITNGRMRELWNDVKKDIIK